MMQFTEIPFSPHPNTLTMNNATQLQRLIRPWPGLISPSSKPISSSPSSSNLNDANCMEQLLVHCAEAIENNDATPAQQILWVLNNIAPPDGDSNQRLTCAFLRALILRAASSSSCKIMLSNAAGFSTVPHRFSLLELAHFVDLTPWHRFGFTAANSVILGSVAEHHSVVHIVDVSTTHCMQIPTLIDDIATRFAALGRVPPLLRLTVATFTQQVPPVFDLLSYDELGLRLMNFARSRNIALEFKAVPTSPSDGFYTLLEELRQHQQQQQCHNQASEALIINCQVTLHYIPPSVRQIFLQGLRRLNPTTVVVVEEDVNLTAEDLVSRLRAAFSYLWIPFDTADTFLTRGSKEKQWYEADVCWKIENVVANNEGARQETRTMWGQRMRESGFQGVEFEDEAMAEVKRMLEEHAAGWGSKKEEEDLVLTWKGHNVVFASAWLPA